MVAFVLAKCSGLYARGFSMSNGGVAGIKNNASLLLWGCREVVTSASGDISTWHRGRKIKTSLAYADKSIINMLSGELRR